MTCRPIVRGFLLIVGVMAILCATAGRAGAQPPVCVSFDDTTVCATPGQPIFCPAQPPVPGGTSSCFAPFTPTFNDWTYVWENNAFRVKTNVLKPFVLQVDMIFTTPAQYAARRASQFAGTVCNPSAVDLTDCEVFRVHGETHPKTGTMAEYSPPVDYEVIWDFPAIAGNPNDYLLLRARCSEFPGDSNVCNGTQRFRQNITTFVDPGAMVPPVPSDPAIGGSADGFSEYIATRCRRGDGDGDFDDKNRDRHHMHFHHNSCESSRGDVEEEDHDSGKKFQSTSVSSADFTSNADGLALTMVGTGLHDGLPVNFTMIAVDHGNIAPGVFMLILSDGYTTTGSLLNGTLVLR
jgi:hypothetical protein